jgi:hypothetical protein
MFLRLTLEQSRDGLVATISERDENGNIAGTPMIVLVRSKEEAKKKASAIAKGLGLTSYRILDKSQRRKPAAAPYPAA